jgi:zinc protease
MRWPRTLISFFMLSVLTLSLQAAEPNGVKKITSIEGITEYRLDNGLQVLLFPDASKPTVTVNLTIFVGSRHEGYGEAGMAHLLEHMLFKGTPTHPKVPKLLQDRGARFNGTTWVDRTNYYETLPASDDNLEFAIGLEADRMMNSYIKGEDLASEMTVVRNEFESGENSPSYVLGQRMMSAAFEWHNYGRSTIGNRADIERVPVENLRVFYHQYYQPDNAMLVVAGKIEIDKTLEFINKHFGVIPRPKRKLNTTYTEEPAQDGERFVTLRRVGDVAVVGAMFHIPSGAHPDFAALDVLESILTAPPAGRLYKSLVESKKAARVSGGAYAWHDPGVIRFMAEVSKGNDSQIVLEAMLDTLDETSRKGVTAEDVERARQRLLKQRELSAANTRSIAVELSEWAAQGDWRLYFLYRDRVEKVTPDDVHRVAKDYLKRNNRTIGMYVPTEKPERITVPQTPDLATMIGDYKGRELVSEGEVFDVSPANIESRTKRLTLSSGIQAAVLSKKTRNEAVTLRLTLRYGNEKNLRGLTTVCEYLPALMRKGTKKLSRQQLNDLLDKNRATLGASGSAGSVTFSIQTKRKNLKTVLEVLRQVMREPTLPESDLDIMKQEQLAFLQKSLADPQALASSAVRRKMDTYPKGDPRYVPSIEEEIEMVKALSRDDVSKLYQEFLGSEHGELTIVGDFDPEEIVPIIEVMLSGWNASKKYAHIAKPGSRDSKGSSEEILTPDKANAMYFAAMTFPVRDDHPDVPALLIGNFILGGGSLSSRLGDRVRQKEGLSYGVGSGYSSSEVDQRSAFYIYAISNPANMPKVKSTIREELDLILDKGVTEQELQKAKQGFLQSQQVSRTSDSSLAGLLKESLIADRTMNYYTVLEQNIEALTTKDVLAALKKHLKPERLNIVVAGDFKKDKKKEEAGKEKD